MALVLSRKPAILLENDDDYRKIIFEGKTIAKSLFADIDNCAEFTKVTIPENVEGVRGDAFEEFVNLQEAEIWGYVEGVERSLGRAQRCHLLGAGCSGGLRLWRR